MLQSIRDKTSGPIAYVVVGLISLVFGVWGIGSYFTESPNPAVAEVGGTEITKYELQRAYDQRYQRLQQLMGDRFDHDSIEPDRFRREVLRGLIERELLAQYARDMGYRVGDQELLAALRQDQRFQVDGEFSADRYRSLLGQAGISAAAFENSLRGDLQVQQIRQGVLDTAFVTHNAVAHAWRLKNQRRKLSYLRFNPSAFRESVDIGQGDIEAYYRDHPDAFMTPERVQLAYVELDKNALKVVDSPDKKILKAIYEQEKEARFKATERRRARHILIRIDEDTSNEAARKEVQRLAKRLEEGADFGELAREHSDDKGTAEKGGQLDWVTRGTMTAAFEETLFKLESGEISKPVKTEFGWHLIKLEEIDPAEVKPFDAPEVQEELRAMYRKQEREERFRQMRDKLDQLAFEAPETLDPIAEELGLEIERTDWITREGTDQGLGQHQSVIDAAFSDAVLKDRLNSTPISLSGDRLVVLRVAEHKPAERKPLETVSDEIRDRLIAQRAREKAAAAAEEALRKAREGGSLEALSGSGPGSYKPPRWISRDDSDMPSALREAVYGLPRPGEGAPAYGKAVIDGGAAVVVALYEVENGDLAEAKDEDTQQLSREARSRLAGLEFSALRQSLRDEYEVVIHEERLN